MTTRDTDELIASRETTHGSFHGVANTLAETLGVWNASEGSRKLTNLQSVALTQIALKIARILNGDPNFADHWIDIAGYARLAEPPTNACETKAEVKGRVEKDVERDASWMRGSAAERERFMRERERSLDIPEKVEVVGQYPLQEAIEKGVQAYINAGISWDAPERERKARGFFAMLTANLVFDPVFVEMAQQFAERMQVTPNFLDEEYVLVVTARRTAVLTYHEALSEWSWDTVSPKEFGARLEAQADRMAAAAGAPNAMKDEELDQSTPKKVKDTLDAIARRSAADCEPRVMDAGEAAEIFQHERERALDAPEKVEAPRHVWRSTVRDLIDNTIKAYVKAGPLIDAFEREQKARRFFNAVGDAIKKRGYLTVVLDVGALCLDIQEKPDMLDGPVYLKDLDVWVEV